jgi:hypothetical protein
MFRASCQLLSWLRTQPCSMLCMSGPPTSGGIGKRPLLASALLAALAFSWSVRWLSLAQRLPRTLCWWSRTASRYCFNCLNICAPSTAHTHPYFHRKLAPHSLKCVLLEVPSCKSICPRASGSCRPPCVLVHLLWHLLLNCRRGDCMPTHQTIGVVPLESDMLQCPQMKSLPG